MNDVPVQPAARNDTTVQPAARNDTTVQPAARNDTTVQPVDNVPIACTLDEPARIKRQQELQQDIFAGCQAVAELADGYVFTYPGSAEWATRLVGFITVERVCCPFFTFGLIFAPGEGPIRLELRGGDGVKEFIGQMLREVTPAST